MVRTASILAVGTELLTPGRSDTNSAYLIARLNELGIDVRSCAVVDDDTAAIAAAVRFAIERADVVVTTGGLGPTADDVTREAVAEALGLSLSEDPGVLAAIRRRFEQRGLDMPPVNRRQALVPAGAAVLTNDQGTAPGLWIEAAGRIVVLLPGPPRELRPIVEDQVAPRLRPLTDGRRILRRVIRIAGRPESHVEAVAQPVYAALATGEVPVATTILASPGLIELHLSARGTDMAAMSRALERGVEALAAALGPDVVSVDGRSLEQVVGDTLLERRARLAVAESCTGGLVAARLTEVPGSSQWFAGGVIAYDNAVKTAALDVPGELLAAHGAVSEPVARAMAGGVRRRMGVEVGVGVTGIAGPSGGSPEKPVGTVVIAVAARADDVRTVRFPGDRQAVRQQAVIAALDLVRLALTRSEM